MSYLAEALIHGNRPSDKSNNVEERCLGTSLIRYTCKTHRNYDPVFTGIIRKLRPDWFKHAIKNKDVLFELARSGAKRPRKNKKRPSKNKQARDEEQILGCLLCNYTNTSSSSYDPIFDREIRKLRPDWFINTATIKKEKLLELARSGAERPNSNSEDLGERKLGDVLIGYTCKKSSSYDPAFDKKIRELRPDWFGRRGPRPRR